MHDVERRRVFREQAEEHLARTEFQRRASGEDGRADHAGGAADHGDASRHALVEVVRPRERQRGEHAAGHEPAGRRMQQLGFEGETRDAHRAAVVEPRAGVQAGLAGNEREGVRGAEGRAERGTGAAVDAARDVERELRAGQGVRRFDDRGGAAVHGAGEPDAEQAVDDEVVACVHRDRLQQPSVHRAPLGVRPRGVARQLGRIVAGEHHVDAVVAALEMRSRFEGVAPVVPRPGEHEHRSAGFAEELTRAVGGGEARTVHQRRLG